MSNIVQVVAPSMVHQIWPQVRDMFEASTSTNLGDCTVDQQRMMLARGEQTLLVSTDSEDTTNKITGIMAIELIDYPNARTAFISAVAGKGVIEPDAWGQIVNWAKQQGATKIQAIAKDAHARLYRQKVGFQSTRQILDMDL